MNLDKPNTTKNNSEEFGIEENTEVYYPQQGPMYNQLNNGMQQVNNQHNFNPQIYYNNQTIPQNYNNEFVPVPYQNFQNTYNINYQQPTYPVQQIVGPVPQQIIQPISQYYQPAYANPGYVNYPNFYSPKQKVNYPLALTILKAIASSGIILSLIGFLMILMFVSAVSILIGESDFEMLLVTVMLAICVLGAVFSLIGCNKNMKNFKLYNTVGNSICSIFCLFIILIFTIESLEETSLFIFVIIGFAGLIIYILDIIFTLKIKKN